MAYILTIETSTEVCSAALFENDQLLALKEEGGQYSHAEKLAVFIDELFQESELTFKDLSAVAVSKGPGSYTGLRIGVTMAKGLCFALNIPLISIDTLKSLAWGIAQQKMKTALLCPTIDARRMEVYTSLFTHELEKIRPVEAVIVEEQFLEEALQDNLVYIFGNGAEKCISTLNHANLKYIKNQLPSASKMGALALEKFSEKTFEDVAYFEPFYLKDFIALKGKKLV
ncbi:MAG: tRNA (adenosine(37)-N6)-threonylcarbamoyltransferase complex dimerization subunit type 1 TsaB [Vicingaceae bacterium]